VGILGPGSRVLGTSPSPFSGWAEAFILMERAEEAHQREGAVRSQELGSESCGV